MPWAKLVGYRQDVDLRGREVHDRSDLVAYLFWMPDFFSRNYGLSLLESGPPLIIIYLLADRRQRRRRLARRR